jgi:hypothetical protein
MGRKCSWAGVTRNVSKIPSGRSRYMWNDTVESDTERSNYGLKMLLRCEVLKLAQYRR